MMELSGCDIFPAVLTHSMCVISAVLVTLRPLCKISLAAPGPDPESLVSDTGQIFF